MSHTYIGQDHRVKILQTAVFKELQKNFQGTNIKIKEFKEPLNQKFQ